MYANGLLELVLEVRDLEVSLRFYKELLDLEVVEQWQGKRKAVWLGIGKHQVIGLWPKQTGGKRGIYGSRGGIHVHFAIYVRNGTLMTLKQKLEKNGYSTYGPVEFDEKRKSLYVKDPDGNVVELAQWQIDWSGNTVE